MKTISFTQKGTRTDDNRDALVASQNNDVSLFIIVDGSTNCPYGGGLARALTTHIEQGFKTLPPQALQFAELKQSLILLLKQAQLDLRTKYPADSASYLLVCIKNNVAIVLHAGDCFLERLPKPYNLNRRKPLRHPWVNRIHCLATAINPTTLDKLKNDPDRHALTQSFKARRFNQPQWQVRALRENERLILSSDGFWAGLSDSQQQYLVRQVYNQEESRLNESDDDISFILIENTKQK
ncbi:hypothetical protein [Alkalimarinus coralli]|uniref:hypothetical protein n=1 Tax=Alkalimarinus coralli TaxID=2935863 RepID=UPI00202AE66C|nr:hypothetical protein [Alkalimarinus coralli]